MLWEPRSLTLRAGAVEFQRQQDSEYGVTGNALALDRSVVLRDERLGDREPKPAASFATGDEREENLVANRVWHTRAVVFNAHRERQLVTSLRQRDTASDARRKPNLAPTSHTLQSLRGVSDDVENRLRELLGVGVELRQADVEVRFDSHLREFRLHDARNASKQLVDVRPPVARRAVGCQQPVNQALQAVCFPDDHLGVLDQRRAVELTLEQLCGPADAAERILDLVREIANELAICLLLLEQPLLAGDLELLIDVPEFEQECSSIRFHRRHRAREMQPRLRVDSELELLLGVRSAGSQCLVDRLEERGRVREDGADGIADQLAPGELEQVLRSRVGVTNDEILAEQQHGGGKQLESGIWAEVRVGQGRKRWAEHSVAELVQRR